jgi:hypothetical protein
VVVGKIVSKTIKASPFLAVFSEKRVRRTGWLPTNRGLKKVAQYSDIVLLAFSDALSRRPRLARGDALLMVQVPVKYCSEFERGTPRMFVRRIPNTNGAVSPMRREIARGGPYVVPDRKIAWRAIHLTI